MHVELESDDDDPYASLPRGRMDFRTRGPNRGPPDEYVRYDGTRPPKSLVEHVVAVRREALTLAVSAG